MVLCPCWDEVNREVKQVLVLSHRKKSDVKILHDRTVVLPGYQPNHLDEEKIIKNTKVAV